jgi:hypothetical protein
MDDNPITLKQSVYRMKLKVKETSKLATLEPAIYLPSGDGHNKILPQGKLVRLSEPFGQTDSKPEQTPSSSLGPLTPAILKTFKGCDKLDEKKAENIVAMLARFTAIIYQAMAS